MNGRENTKDVLDRAVDEVLGETIPPGAIAASEARILERLRAADACAPFRADLAAVTALSPARRRLLDDHLKDCPACRKLRRGETGVVPFAAPAPRRRVGAAWLAAAAVVVVALALAAWRLSAPAGAGPATVMRADGALFRISGDALSTAAAGAALEEGQRLRTALGARAVVRLADGSEIEMKERSEIELASRADGTVIELVRGDVIVEASPQGSGHLYVSTADCLVAVTGTIFTVSHGARGSRVGVVEGSVRVDQGGRSEMLRPGSQTATSEVLEPVPVAEQVAWSRNADQYRALLAELVALGREVDRNAPLPGLGTSSGLLDLAPADTVVLAALPNATTTLTEGYRLFQQRLATSPELSAWWEETRTPERDAHIDEALKRLQAVGSELGGEIVFALGPQPSAPLFLAEARNPEALLAALRAEADRIGHLVVTTEAPGGAGNGEDVYVLVENGRAFASPDPARVREAAAAAVAGRSAFAGTPLHARMARAHADGSTWLFGADFREARETEVLGATLSGLIVEREEQGDRSLDRAELSFDGARTGIAAWLAPPSVLAGLEFVSPDAPFAAAFAVREPRLMVDDLFQAVGAPDPADVEAAAGRALVTDLAATLGGEAVAAIDGPILPLPAWKLVLEVYDPAAFRAALAPIVAAIDVKLKAEGRAEGASIVDEPGGFLVRVGPVEAHGAFSDGFLVLAPSRALVDRALQVRSSGATLPASTAFRGAFPEGSDLNVSGLGWLNLGPALDAAPGTVAESLRGPAILVTAVAAEDRISLETAGRAGIADDLERLLAFRRMLPHGDADVPGR